MAKPGIVEVGWIPSTISYLTEIYFIVKEATTNKFSDTKDIN